MKQDVQNHAQGGNALFIILIAVALLAALSFAVSQSMRGGATNALTEERARLMATDLIEYANTLAGATAQTRLRGFNDTQVSFETPVVAGYANAGCTQAMCKIFNPAGGAASYVAPPADAMAASPAPDNEWHIYGDNAIQNIGTTCAAASCADLILLVDELALSVCQQINGLLGITAVTAAPPTDTSFGETLFTGAYGYTATVGDEDAALDGARAACFQKTTAPAEYAFYRVLIAR